MKTFLLKNPKRILAIAGLASICGLFGTASAQTHPSRVYATTQGWSSGGLSLGGAATVTGSANAVTASPLTDFSTLSTTTTLLSLGPTVTQYLEFPAGVTEGTQIHIKLSLPVGLVNIGGLLGHTSIGTFTSVISNPGTSEGASVTGKNEVYSDQTLIDVLAGAGTNEVLITAPANCHGVYITLSALVSVGKAITSSLNLFHAYYMGSTPGDAGCPEPIDILSGITADGGLANIGGGITGAVNDPWKAIDDDASLSTYARLFVGAGIANKTYLDALFNVPAKANDSVTMVIQDSANGVLSLASASVLTSIKIQPYMDNTPVGAAIPLDNSGLIKLSLFPGTSSKGTITFPVTAGDFNRVEISFQGIAGVSRGLNVYNIAVEVPAPTIAEGTLDKYVYKGNSINLNNYVTPNGTDGIVWYDAAEGGNVVSSPFTVTSDVPLYAASLRDGCPDASGRRNTIKFACCYYYQ